MLLHGCGHFLHIEQPDRFAQAVRTFLDAFWVPPTQLRRLADPAACLRSQLERKPQEARLHLQQHDLPAGRLPCSRS